MLRFVVTLLAMVACSKSDHVTPAPSEPIPSPTVAGSGSQASHDPWASADAGSAAITDEPNVVANHARAEQACPMVTAPYFYSVEKAGKKSFILGTRHVGVALAKMPKVVKDQLVAAKLAVLETPPDQDESKPDASRPSLADQLGPDLWKHFVELVGKEAADAIEHMKPSVAVAGLSGIYEDITQTLDVEIEQFATAHHIPIQGLETNEFQDKLLDKMLDLRMLKAAVSQIKDRGELETDSRDDLSSYCAGIDKDPGLDPKMKKQMLAAGYTEKELAAIDDQMLFARNRDWIPKLEKILAPGSVFVAVGADHLRGPRGVIAQLTAKGFATARIAP